ncbi:MAG TPA: DinB family protein [Chloroflexia bacterium]|nr:DinB family protein [Chloroflexia bacterium]
MSTTDSFVQDIITLHQAVHGLLREEIAGLDAAALNWKPVPESSAIGTLIVHALGAEAEMLRNLLQIPTDRVRDAEFAAQQHAPAALERTIAAAEQDWLELAPQLDAGALQTERPRPNKPVPQSGLFWLVRNYGHMREHVAQIQLTKQLYAAQTAAPA